MKTILITATLVVLGACASAGSKIDVSQLSEMRKGQTTVAEVLRKFGRPNLLSKNWDGTQTAAYSAGEAGSDAANALPVVGAVMSGGSAGADSVIFYFDTNGVLADYKMPRTLAAARAAPATPALPDTPVTPAVQSIAPVPVQQGAAPPPPITPNKVQPEAARASPARKREDGLPFWLPSDSKDVRF